MHWFYESILTALFFVFFAWATLFFVRWKIPKTKLKDSHDVVGFAYGVVGVIYAVLLGFTVVNVQERFNEAVHVSESEANSLADLYRDAEVLGPPYNAAIREKILKYIKLVLEEEWPLMQQGTVPQSVIEDVRSIWYEYYKIEPKTEREKIWLAESVSKLNEFTSLRLKRIYNSSDTLSPIMWALLYIGAAISIGFLSFFWVENLKLHIIVVTSVAALIGFMLYLIQALDSVYWGDISVRPEALEEVGKFLQQWY